ncbi:MAG: SDR family NAD(P)-dependent oxidoreductase [Candidatus Thorarchaeota archaeon]|jgi:NAD(P)-dependent dehydrogenase (short-subunit alcohol dehydrogenase family)
MKILIIGGTGGVGTKLVPMLSEEYEVESVGSKVFNLNDSSQMTSYLEESNPDVIINAAGISSDGFLHKISYDDMVKQVSVNAIGAANLLKAAVPIMRENNKGNIIFLSSVLSREIVMGAGIYSATKAFIETLVRVSAMENARKNIRINGLRLGYMDAGMKDTISSDMLERIKISIPLGNFGAIDNIALAIKFLVEADYITGTLIDITGGL